MVKPTYNDALKFLCFEEHHKLEHIDMLTKYLQGDEIEKFQELIIELSVIHQKIQNLECDFERHFLFVPFSLGDVLGSREFHQKIDLKTGQFHPMGGSELP